MAYQRVTPTKLGQAAITAVATTLYTVPASTRTLLKDIDIVNTSGGALTVDVYLVPSGGAAATTNALFYGYSINANSNLQWTGLQVLNAGDTIQIKASGLGCTIIASGGEAA